MQVWESSANDLSHPLNHHKAWPRRHLPKPLCSSKFTEHSHVLSSTHNSKAVLVLVTNSSDAGGLWNQRDTRMRLVIMSSCFGQGYTSAASFVQWSTGLLWGRSQPLRNHMSLISRHWNSSSSFINYILLEINPGLFLRVFFFPDIILYWQRTENNLHNIQYCFAPMKCARIKIILIFSYSKCRLQFLRIF